MEPRHTEAPRDWQNLFPITRFRYIEVLFRIFYYNWGKKKKIVCYTEDLCRELELYRLVISRLVELHVFWDRLRPLLYGKKLSREGELGYTNSQANWTLRILCLSRLHLVNPAERVKVYTWRKFGPARRMTLVSKRMILLSGSPFQRANCHVCFSRILKGNVYIAVLSRVLSGGRVIPLPATLHISPYKREA